MANVFGFGSISRRQSKKPIIAAVNGGGAYGGGTEMVLNCDYVVAGDQAKFALPEVKRGVIAVQGGESGLLVQCFPFPSITFRSFVPFKFPLPKLSFRPNERLGHSRVPSSIYVFLWVTFT